VISLPDQIKRRQRIESQLKALGLPYAIVEAVDGRKGLPAVCELIIDRKGTIPAMRRRMSDAEYACAMSHMIIYRKVLDAELPGAIILEDDAELAPGFAEFVAQGAYQAADIVKLDYRRALVWKWWRIPICPGVDAYRMTRNSGLLTGYTISARAAGRILKRGLPIRRHADWPIDVTLLKSFVSFPRLVAPNDQAGSSLQGERSAIKRAMARRRPLLRRARDLLTAAISTELK
jgi:glycosyl transferase family 25